MHFSYFTLTRQPPQNALFLHPQDWLLYPEEWGPTEWGPIPFLPSADLLVRKLEKQWGPLEGYKGLRTTSQGDPLISGLQFGNVWIGVPLNFDMFMDGDRSFEGQRLPPKKR